MAKVAFLGPKGSFTHQVSLRNEGKIHSQCCCCTPWQSPTSKPRRIMSIADPDTKAALKHFSTSEYTLSVQPTFEDIFLSIQSNSTEYGIVPIENSSNGPVTQTLNLLGDRKGRFADLQVTGEVYLPVEHYLLGHAPKDSPPSDQDDTRQGEPLYDLSHLSLVESHPQALGQCKAFLSKYCKDIKRRDTSSTSQAAENAKTDSTGKTAAIASKLCADITGLTILAAAMQDDSRNTTRFIILQRMADVPDESPRNAETGGYKTLVVFTVSHEEPGSLAKALAVFSKHDISLTGMHTAPLGEGMWQYSFFVEFHGRREGTGSGKVERALFELEDAVRWVRWLGSWKDGGEQ